MARTTPVQGTSDGAEAAGAAGPDLTEPVAAGCTVWTWARGVSWLSWSRLMNRKDAVSVTSRAARVP